MSDSFKPRTGARFNCQGIFRARIGVVLAIPSQGIFPAGDRSWVFCTAADSLTSDSPGILFTHLLILHNYWLKF